jgi:hypothetical protein
MRTSDELEMETCTKSAYVEPLEEASTMEK